jgi:hypothetical protein
MPAGDPKIGLVPESYRFIYKGGDLPSLASQQPVLRRIKNSGAQGADQLIKTFTLGLLDLGKFQQMRLQNFALVEDREFGYMVNVDLSQGTASIYQNWEKWPQPYAQCQDEACMQRYRLQLSALPSDAEALSIARAFLNDHGISTTAYGAPYVNNDWREDFERSQDKANYYIPDSVSVVYPLQLEGQTVLDEGGNRTGLYVSVDVRHRRVSNVSELTSQRYEKSLYEGETDQNRLVALAERGGWRSYYPLADAGVQGQKIVNLDLGTPTIGLMRLWHYTVPVSQELYVPALVFPVTNRPVTPGYFPKQVAIPLVKEVLSMPDAPVTLMGESGY